MIRSAFALILATLPVVAADPPEKPSHPANRLAKESSPYLLQHAHNPVDWYPWGPEAFAKAKKENKLVFLSVGYSSCHWCHVMERESFSNEAVAKLMNDKFVCIKVDREERPDIDDIYMISLHVIGLNGGWPMSVFLTPDAKPIFGGTYFPPEDRKVDGDTIPGFKTILKNVCDLYAEKPKELFAQADAVAERTAAALGKSALANPLVSFDRALIQEAADAFEFDPEQGGFGSKSLLYRGPKFPRAAGLAFLWKHSELKGQETLRENVELALRKMAAGGIYDHVGGGFHRYAVERTWTIPHFEKMLYDNAQLVELYAEAYRTKPDPLFKTVIEDTLAFVSRELIAPSGGFYSALDADSAGKEGEFYVWTPKQIDEALGSAEDSAFVRKVFDLEKPNFEGKAFVLRFGPRPVDAATLAKLVPIQSKLLAARSGRVRPFRDTKILTGWNGQMIAAYARAGQVLNEPKYIASAEKAARFVLDKLRTKSGRLMRSYTAKPGEKPEARGIGFLDDYAFLVHGLLALHDATKQDVWLKEARALTDVMIANFTDTVRGGFYNTPHDGEKLFARGKDVYDGAQLSGNGAAVRNLVRLWAKTGIEEYKKQSESGLKFAAAAVKASPTSGPVSAEAATIFLDRVESGKK
ncbi:MAG TPA: thioredoxin domain-containing protein [Fimbriiglobus sp.]|jgi:hypothetical protein